MRARLTLLEDDPDRGRSWRDRASFRRDFHIRIDAFSSYFNMPNVRQDWGFGMQVEAMSFGFGIVELHAGGGYNYYEDLIMLPVPMVSSFWLTLGGAL